METLKVDIAFDFLTTNMRNQCHAVHVTSRIDSLSDSYSGLSRLDFPVQSQQAANYGTSKRPPPPPLFLGLHWFSIALVKKYGSTS